MKASSRLLSSRVLIALSTLLIAGLGVYYKKDKQALAEEPAEVAGHSVSCDVCAESGGHTHEHLGERVQPSHTGHGQAASEAVAHKSIPIDLSIIEDLLAQDSEQISFMLPGDILARGRLTSVKSDSDGVHTVSGFLSEPRAGFFYFHRQLAPSVVGPMSGDITFKEGNVGYVVEVAAEGHSVLVETTLDRIQCVGIPLADDFMPEEHLDFSEPGYQNSVPLLESLRGAVGVIYLDFDGHYVEAGTYWSNTKNDGEAFTAEPRDFSDSTIRRIWEHVAEDFAPFNLNVTTDLAVFEAAPSVSRQHVVITPTDTAGPGYGGIANYNSFNETYEKECWVFNAGTSSCPETISHEVGHALYLYHDGRAFDDGTTESYYRGHGTSPVEWGAIMGAPFNIDITHWSQGEYLDANEQQDDLAVIESRTNVDYRADDHGADFASATYLEIFSDDTVSSQGIITETGEYDAFRFTMDAAGDVDITISPARYSPNMDIRAEIMDDSGAVLHTDYPEDETSTYTLEAAFSGVSLSKGDYFIRVAGSARGDVLGDGYSNYGTLGYYQISGSITNAEQTDRFTIEELSPNGTVAGLVAPRNDHGSDPISFSISSTSLSGAFAVDASDGELTVADSTQLVYLDLATNFDSLAEVELFVSITNSIDSSLDELVRVVVSVFEINDAPVLEDESFTVDGDLASGTLVAVLDASDPDYALGVVSYSIIGGNTDSAFSINDDGEITTLIDLDYFTIPSYVLTVQVADNGSPSLTDTASITINLTEYNNAPVADAGPDQSVADIDNSGSVSVTLDGSLSSDVETSAANLIYEWVDVNDTSTVLASVVTPTISLDVGAYQLQLTVTDEAGATDTDIVNIDVRSFFNPVDFTETYEPGETGMASSLGSLDGQQGWQVSGSGSATVQTSIVRSGTQAALISNAILSRQFVNSPRELVVSFWIKPDKQLSTSTIRLDGAVEVSIAPTGQLSAYDGETSVALGSPTLSNQWSQLVIECNYPAETWSLSANGTMLISGFAFKSSQAGLESIEFETTETKGLYLDDIEISEPVEETGLLAYWAMDEGSGSTVSDVSGNGHDGDLAGSSWVSGKQGSAVEFDAGSDAVSLPASAFESITDQVSIAMWVYGDTTQPRADSIFYAKDTSGNRVLNVHLPWNNNYVYWDAGDDTGFDRINKVATSDQFMGQWNYWVFTKDASAGTMAIYLNGVLWHTGSNKSRSMDGVVEGYISGNGGSNRYDGIVDEVKLYNLALSDTEVADLYTAYENSSYTIPADYDAWLVGNPDLVDTSFSGDPEDDGIETGLEYVLNGDPIGADTHLLPELDASGENFVFTFSRLVASGSDTNQIFQYGSSLTGWTDVNITDPIASEVTLGAELNGMQTVTVTISKNLAVSGKLFGRLMVEDL